MTALAPAAAHAVIACDKSYSNPGYDGWFSSDENWAPDGVAPGPNDDACLPDSDTPYVITVYGAQSAKGVIVGRNATLQIEGSDTFGGDAVLAIGSGGVQNFGTVEFNDDSASEHNRQIIGSVANADNGTVHTVRNGRIGTLTNAGTATVDTGATLTAGT